MRSFVAIRNFHKFSISFLKFRHITSSSVLRHASTLSRSGFNDYEKERISFNIPIPEKFNFVSDVIDVWAHKEQTGERKSTVPALWYVSAATGEEQKWNFQEISKESKKVSHFLQHECGVMRGESVIVMLPKIPEFWMVNMAAIHAGAILCPGSMMLTVKDLIHRFSKFRPVCFIAHENAADVIDEASAGYSCLRTKVLVSKSGQKRQGWLDYHQLFANASSEHPCADTRSDESMMVFFTSGTMGAPKMVEHSHSSYGIGHLTTGKYFLDMTSENLLWNLSDTGWAKTAYSSIFGAWAVGGGVFVYDMPRFSPTECLEVLTQYPVDTFCAPPMAYRLMVREDLSKYKLKNPLFCLSGGETVSPEVINLWEQGFGSKIYSAYGQTETVALIGTFRCIENKPESLGKPSPALDIVILDENENEVGPGVLGEIAVRKRNGKIFGVFLGYKNDPEKSAETLTEKYMHTGDLGYYENDGYFYFVGRKDDLVNSAGYRIGPSEVEGALMEHEAVAEVAVTSSPDEERGEVVKAFIVLKGSFLNRPQAELIKELQEHTKRTTAPYKYPRKIEFMKELPKTTSGKVRRADLKRMEWESAKRK